MCENVLKSWRIRQGWTQKEMSTALGIGSARTYQRYETGEKVCPVPVAERIRLLTRGDVAPADLHRLRVDWLRANRPEIVLEPALAPGLECGGE